MYRTLTNTGVRTLVVHDNLDQVRPDASATKWSKKRLNVVGRRIGQADSEPNSIKLLDVTLLFPLWEINPIAPTPELYQSGLRVQTRYGFSFYDSLIVAAALEAGCTTLYSEDMQDGQRIEGLTIRNPFAEMRTE